MGAAERTVLQGVPPLHWGGLGTPTDDVMVSSALKVCLDYIGEEYSRTYLAGTSGAAFDTGWAAGTMHSGAGGAIFAHPNHCEMGYANLLGAIGREYTMTCRTDPGGLWDAVVRSVDAGRPVIATEWKIDHFAMLCGYGAKRKEFLGRRYAGDGEAPEEYVAIDADEVGYVLAVGEATEQVPPDQAVLGALRFAVWSAETGRNAEARGQGGTSHPMVYGPEAYREHAGLVEAQLDPDDERYELREHFLFWRLDGLSLARAYAVLYLEEAKAQCRPEVRDHIAAAIQSYCGLLAMIETINIDDRPPYRLGSQVVEPSLPRVDIFQDAEKLGSAMLWREGEGERSIRELLSTGGGRREFADWLLKMRDFDAAAVRSLAAAVEAWG